MKHDIDVLMAERDALRVKILALSKNKESRLNQNALILHTRRYAEATDTLRSLGKKVSISSDLLKTEHWREQYRKFNEANPNIIMPTEVSNNVYKITVGNNTVCTFKGTNKEYDLVYKVIDALTGFVGSTTEEIKILKK